MTTLDIEKPTPKDNEIMCSACWTVVKKDQAIGWHYFSFKHLESVNLCLICQPEWLEHNFKIQKAGL